MILIHLFIAALLHNLLIAFDANPLLYLFVILVYKYSIILLDAIQSRAYLGFLPETISGSHNKMINYLIEMILNFFKYTVQFQYLTKLIYFRFCFGNLPRTVSI